PIRRFAPPSAGIFVAGGIKPWIVIRLIAPIILLIHPSSRADAGLLTGPQLFPR
ncbi:hypothetical protein BU15DRAFT_43198, partial [Melanogaster broomeanus]